MLCQASEHIRELRRSTADAWHEREMVMADHYEVLRGVLRVLGDLELENDAAASRRLAIDGLQRILTEQQIEPIESAKGDPFQPDVHVCEEMIDSDLPAGLIVQTLETGYLCYSRDGQRVVIRPARVVVSRCGLAKEV